MTRATKQAIARELARLTRERDDPSGDDDVEVSVSWREADPDARPEGSTYDPATGDLIFDVWDAQRAVLDVVGEPETDIVAFLAGYGSGKSVLGARWLLEEALANPGSHFLAMGVDYQKARDSTFRVLFEQLPGERTTIRTRSFNGPAQSPIVDDYTRAEHRLTLTNDTVITLGSADQWSRYAGTEYGAVWLDEPSHYESDLHQLNEVIGSRFRGPKASGSKTQLWTLTGNGYNAAWEILEQRQDSTGEPIGHNIELIRASTFDNPYLDAGDLDRFERQYGDTKRAGQALHGEFSAAQGLVYSAFDRDTHVISGQAADEMVDDWRVYGYDSGWNNPRVLLEIGRTPADQLVVLDCFYETETHLTEAIAWLTDNDKPEGTIYCDHNPAHIDRFNDTPYAAVSATKDRDEGIAEVRRRFEADGNLPITTPTTTEHVTFRGSPRKIREQKRQRNQAKKEAAVNAAEMEAESEVEGAVGLLISDRCQPLIRELLSYKTDQVQGGGGDDHCLDALRYACMGVAGR